MNNEPVAWMMKSNDPDYVSDYIMFKTPERKDKISHHAIPLYTHPAKTLTDEEILDFINAFCIDMGDYWDLNENNAVPMIRAILRKASKK
jgi:hypothetical protein